MRGAAPPQGLKQRRRRQPRLWLAAAVVCIGLLRAFTDLPPQRLFVTAPGAHGRSPASAQGLDRHGVASREVGVHRASGTVESEALTIERNTMVQAWGAFGVVAYLSFGVAKVVPIVLEGISTIEAPFDWALLAVTLLFFAYVEGYKGFQLGFSPRVVSRAWVVSEETEEAPMWHKILAPAFCIGYFHGTGKRVATSWGVTTVIFAVVLGVKQLGNPYRAIIDAGVIVGLVWGILSIIVLFLASLKEDQPPDYDPSLPEDTPYTSTYVPPP